MAKQSELAFEKEAKKPKAKDEFAESCRPLAELLDSVRNIDGFPIGKDEDILALSDPPYYTACPNPYINDYIARYGKPYDAKKDKYKRAPFVADVSEGKNDPIYNAHSYHTKVPHKAIMPFIEHYTEPGDIVFDGFCGTGMTGVAAQMVGRRAILSDLSPAASLVAYNYNTPVDIGEFNSESARIVEQVEEECGWMYETRHTDGKKGRVNFVLWSDVFICPYCKNEYVFSNVAWDKDRRKILDTYKCTHCQAEITKRESQSSMVKHFDPIIGQDVIQAKQVPVLINCKVGKKRVDNPPGEFDKEMLKKIDSMAIPYWFPTDRMPEGDESRRNDRLGITHVHHFYSKANLWTMAAFWHWFQNSSKNIRNRIILAHSASNFYLSRMRRFRPDKKGGGPLAGTLYVSSLTTPPNVILTVERNLKYLSDGLREISKVPNRAVISTQSATDLPISDNSIDYIFTDPPFGDNIMYSELNFLWEAWLKVFTNNKPEAIMNDVQLKGLDEYKELMTSCFKEMYRILKPNRWITVVFHNSKASVWNAIRDAMTKAGFIVAQVTVLDKKQGSFKQVTSAGAVKNDLVINAYKPKKEFEEHFLRLAGEGLEIEFVKEHLDHLPVEINIERTDQMLYSKMLAHYFHRGYDFRMNAREFYGMLRDHFKLIDGFWFNDDQVLDYEEWKKAQGLDKIREIKSGEQLLFVTDEKSLIVWLYQFLETPQTYSDIYTASRKMISGVEDEIPELRELLDQNFIMENGSYRRPRTREEEEKIEAQRQRDLLRSFDQVINAARTSTKKIKGVRKEAIVLGFTQAYQEKRYQDIIDVAKRLDPKIIENDSQINDFVEFARFKTGEDL
ncbi:DNA methylase N-4/N-6 [Syntrophomonas zehnderi OL-4]|uniref:DNA methylase N-4/N-6 n=1 Tax=Syntrophomonas zehnderi OL-4 TaxID=690567 RepID=A0A0E3W2Z4_9FIRM|nr:DNA methyltransferase [Syntrophomonas zehnderi]CFX06388.1 DNA methylase N-4/N-6 [Syntrophomonas zehnderi OL-4]CFX33327.1 DNA methylase N-4/N-6 [Syntrophomonas zehnderi OL-4]